ncbi:MAG: hypothetical protein JWN48_2632 [Myxococcaceae bacterium]|nr:hypothetical protein [Myxococcaceae bacterium]
MPSVVRVLLLSIYVSAGLLSGCSSGGDPAPVDTTEDPDPSSESTGDELDARVTIKDAARPSPRVDGGSSDAGLTTKTDASSEMDGGHPTTAPDASKPAQTPDASKPAQTPDASKPAQTPDAAVPTTGTGGRCVKKPSQVMIIGDSYINWPTHTLPAELDRASKQTGWRLNAIGGASMATGGIATLVPAQFDQSYALDNDVHTVVMDGGGNDVLIADATLDPGSDCKNSTMSAMLPQCQKIVQTANEAFAKLLKRMADVGVQDVAFFYYPHVPEGTLLGGAHPNVINDYSRPKAKSTCDAAEASTAGKLRCHFIDMVPVFQGHNDWFFPGDIHPTSVASPAMAGAIWKVMKDACVGQLPASGCCRP